MYNNFTLPLKITGHNRSLVEAAKKVALELADMHPEALSYNNFKLFAVQGSREEYEAEYMLHRKMLCAFMAMTVIDEDEKWLDKLCDIIWAMCDEYTWALPAHLLNSKTAAEKVERLDLFAGETAAALSEIYHILGDKLPEYVRERIVYEVRRRVIEPYKKRRNKFGISNWSAVCGYGVGAAFVYLGTKEEFEDIKPNLLGNMQDFLDSYTDDGCCLEGALYWSYGFSHFCFLAELLRQYTGGEIDFFKDEKVKRMAFFYQNINLGANYFVPFSDAPHTCSYDAGLLGLLSEKYDGIIIPPSEYENKFGDFGNDSRFRFAPFIRNLCWGKLPSDSRKPDKRCIYYDDAKWYINKNHDYIFAAKAGHNDEPHNHNDVGSFILFDNNEFIVEDIGWSKYDKDYFAGEKRYENLCASSLGHSVPVIDGAGQKAGRQYAARVISANEEGFALELSDAYGNEAVRSFERSFILKGNGIVIKDAVDADVKTVSRFVTRIKPVVKNDCVYVNNYAICSCQKSEVTISSFEYAPRFEGFDSSGENVQIAYTIDFEVSDPAEVEYTILKITE